MCRSVLPLSPKLVMTLPVRGIDRQDEAVERAHQQTLVAPSIRPIRQPARLPGTDDAGRRAAHVRLRVVEPFVVPVPDRSPRSVRARCSYTSRRLTTSGVALKPLAVHGGSIRSAMVLATSKSGVRQVQATAGS